MIGFSTVSALPLNAETIINTTVSNSSITISSINLTVDSLTVETTYAYLENASWTNGDLEIINSTPINWSETNTNINTLAFPYISYNAANEKNISSNLSQTINATVKFVVSTCTNLDTVSYVSASGSRSYDPTFSCTGGIVTIVDLLDIENTTSGNALTLTYGTVTPGGGGGGSTTLPSDSQLDHIELEFEEEWPANVRGEIKLFVFNASNSSIDPEFVEVNFSNVDVEYELIRKDVGFYRIIFQRINESVGTEVEFVVTVEDEGTMIAELDKFVLIREDLSEKIKRKYTEPIVSFLAKIFQPITEHPYISAGIIMLVIALLILAQYLINSKRWRR